MDNNYIITQKTIGYVKTELCHHEHSEGSLASVDYEILRVAQNDMTKKIIGCVSETHPIIIYKVLDYLLPTSFQ